MSEASELLDTIGGAALPRCDLMLCDGPRPHQSIYGYNIKIIGSTGLQFTHASTGAKTAANRRQREGKLKCTSCIVACVPAPYSKLPGPELVIISDQ